MAEQFSITSNPRTSFQVTTMATEWNTNLDSGTRDKFSTSVTTDSSDLTSFPGQSVVNITLNPDEDLTPTDITNLQPFLALLLA